MDIILNNTDIYMDRNNSTSQGSGYSAITDRGTTLSHTDTSPLTHMDTTSSNTDVVSDVMDSTFALTHADVSITEVTSGYSFSMLNIMYNNISSVTDTIPNVTGSTLDVWDTTPTAARSASHALQLWSAWYAQKHGYVSVVVCLCGILMNAFNIIVLTQPKMRSISNMILTGLAVSDGLTMMSYIPFALQFYILYGFDPNPDRNSLPWIKFFLFHVNFTVTVHTISIWLCVLLAVFRYICVRSASSQIVITERHTLISIAGVYVASVVILIPNYLTLTIVSATHAPTNGTMYDIANIDPSSPYGAVMTSLNFWIHAVLIKIIPCVLMCTFGFLLLRTMHTARQKQKKLRRASKLSTTSSASSKRKSRDHTRTTGMLVIVILLFLVTELPQGILALLSGTLDGFFVTYYVPLGDLMDSLALINNAINFVLYCSMSKQFRDTFLALFCCCCIAPNGPSNLSKTQNDDFSVYTALRRLIRRETYTQVPSSQGGICVNTV